MNVLVIYTHPNRESLNAAFLEKTVSGLKQNSGVKEIEVVDLYAEEFNPALVFNKTERRRDMYKVPELQKYREQITKADTIIMIYPIWWGRPPAMFLGFIDRLFTTNFAYRTIKGKLKPEGLLKDKKVFCISTMEGPTGYLKLLMGNVHQILMKRVVLNFIGIKKVKFFEFGSMEVKDGKQIKRLNQIERVFSNV